MSAVLKELARDTSSESRFELLVQLSDYVQDQSANLVEDNEKNFLAIAEHILAELSPETRAAFAAKAATYSWLPRPLAVMLGNAEFNVAKPILETSDLLNDEDLLEIARKRGLAHRQAIARRTNLSEAVVDQLIELGEEKVFLDLFRNEQTKKQLHVLRKLIENCRGMRVLQEALIMSDEIPTAEYDLLGKTLDGSLRLRYVAQKNKRAR